MHSLVLDNKENVKLSWMVDWKDRDVLFQVKNAVSPDYKWFAFGFSRRGEFPRTDFCIYQEENDVMDTIVASIVTTTFKKSVSNRLKTCEKKNIDFLKFNNTQNQ